MKKFLSVLLLSSLLASTAYAGDIVEEYRGVVTVGKRDDITSVDLHPQTKVVGTSGQNATTYWATTSVTLSGATTAATGLIPAKATYHGCVVRITTAVTGATTWDLGDGTDADRWGDNEALAAGTVTTEGDFTAVPYGWSATALNPTFTANGSNFTGGVAKISCLLTVYDGATS